MQNFVVEYDLQIVNEIHFDTFRSRATHKTYCNDYIIANYLINIYYISDFIVLSNSGLDSDHYPILFNLQTQNLNRNVPVLPPRVNFKISKL